jgi:hypothetical protein
MGFNSAFKGLTVAGLDKKNRYTDGEQFKEMNKS